MENKQKKITYIKKLGENNFLEIIGNQDGLTAKIINESSTHKLTFKSDNSYQEKIYYK